MKKAALHFCPSNGYFGDPMPFYHDGIYHIYYTKRLREPETLTWGHISSTDLIHFTEHPDPFDWRLPMETRPLTTGCVCFKDGIFHAFYQQSKPIDGKERRQNVFLHAVSEDGISFTYKNVCLVGAEEPGYTLDSTWRDPYVFFDPEIDKYRMVFCARGKHDPHCPTAATGVIGQAVSSDLEEWELLPPLSLACLGETFECPEIFPYGDRYALIYYWHETRFRTAKSLEGPWERSEIISPDRFDFMAARHMFDGKRHFLVGWLPRRDCDCAERIWGGNMLAIRELSFENDRIPQTKFTDELTRVFSKPVPSLSPENALFWKGDWKTDGTGFSVSSPTGGTMAIYREMPDTCLVDMEITITEKTGVIQILLGTHGKGKDTVRYTREGYFLMLDAGEQMIRLRRHYQWDQRNDIAVIPFRFIPGKPFRLRILRNLGILEAEVDGKQTLVSRLLQDAHGGLALWVQDTDAEIKNFRVLTIKE